MLENKEVGKIYETKNYSMFKLSSRNRNIHIKPKQRKGFDEFGIIAPIIVNENYTIVDGQHRWEYAKQKKIPIKYIVIKGLSDEHIVAMNTTQETWNIMDYTASFANDGDAEYQKLFNLLKYTNLPKTSLVSVSIGNLAGGSAKKIVSSGKFKFKDYKRTIKYIEEFENMIDKTNLKPKANLFSALAYVYQSKNFSMKRFINKLHETNAIEEFNARSYKEKDTLILILNTYNHKLNPNSIHYIDFVISSTGAIKITS